MTLHPLLRLSLFVPVLLAAGALHAAPAPELSWAIAGDPRSFDPAKVEDETEETIRYLSGGVLIRLNRQTQVIEPALAEKWTVTPDGRTVVFSLRPGLRFSDGTSLTSRDVAWSIRHILDKKTESALADEFLKPSEVTVETPSPQTVRVHLPTRIVTLGSLFDEIVIQPEGKPCTSRVSSGIYSVDQYQPGRSIHLSRNNYYWKHYNAGLALPQVAGVRLEVMQNRDEEVMRFRRGQLSLIDELPPEYLALINRSSPPTAHDIGPSLDTEQLWFNQGDGAPIPETEKAWFRNQDFRLAVAQAVRRSDLVGVAFAGHATPADSFISPANVQWRNTQLRVPREDKQAALARLNAAGFRMRAGLLYDAGGNQVTFSLLTNAGNAAREKMAALIQQDLLELGMRVNIITLGFPELIERLMHSQNYEACLLGVVNVQPDPSTGANLWLSSSEDHQWNPKEPRPATPWEAEIDTLIRAQGASGDRAQRKQAWDRIQQIVADQQPFIYLVHRDITFAASPAIQGISPAPLRPQLIWNIDTWRVSAQAQ
jgi:peptide/nickel transport system substrate-binding protein